MDMTPDEDFHNALYLSVGQLVIPWAFVEQGLTQWVEIIYTRARSPHGESTIPTELRRKMEFIKKCFKTTPSIMHLEPRVKGMIERMHPIIDARHWLIHGTLSKWDLNKQTFTFVRMDANKQHHRINQKQFTFKRVLKLGQDCLDLSKETSTFSHDLLDIFMPENMRHKFSRKRSP
ncbi:hypothetical protein [Ferrovibrio sp.]|uniref:hypothetical protein n=1 Tax=Ferrovibrio sp. TaxID=1917215 RepID=UPI00351627D8